MLILFAHRDKKMLFIYKWMNLFLSARFNLSVDKGAREQRVGVQKESLASTLATTAAKLTENPPVSVVTCVCYNIETSYLYLNSLTILQRSQRCKQWNTFRHSNVENVDFRHRLFLYFAGYLI